MPSTLAVTAGAPLKPEGRVYTRAGIIFRYTNFQGTKREGYRFEETFAKRGGEAKKAKSLAFEGDIRNAGP